MKSLRADARRSGSALLVTLGLLAVASALIFAFALSARTERLASRRAKEGFDASGHLDSALAIVMIQRLPYYLQEINPQDDYHFPSAGRTSGFDRWRSYFPGSEEYHSAQIATSYVNDPDSETITNFLSGPVTNYIPAALHGQMTDRRADWIPIQTIDENSANNDVLATNAQLAYAIIDLSGFLDACTISSNQAAWLETNRIDIVDSGLFLEDRARQTAPGENDMPSQGGYVTYRDLALRNRGLTETPGYLLHYSFDPAPDVTSTGRIVYGSTLYDGKYSGYLPKFDLNSWTNGLTGALDDPTALKGHYAGDPFLKDWLRPVTNRLATCGFAAAEAIAWNLVNFMDGDRIPQGPDGTIRWREDWPVEDVPLINEIAVAQVPSTFGDGDAAAPEYTNCYSAAVELWYPFAPNAITNEDHAKLVVAVYTNWYGKDAVPRGTGWEDKIIDLEEGDEHGFTVAYDITNMCYGTSTEYLTFSLPPPYVSFPVSVTNLSETGSGPLYGPTVKGDWSRIRPKTGGDRTGEGRHLVSTTFNLPLGIQSYSTYVRVDDTDDIWARRNFTVTNEIRLITRVKVQGQWVDEAMAFSPEPKDGCYTNPPYAFREPCGFEVDDPRRNGRFDDWTRYTGGDRTAFSDGGDDVIRDRCTLSGTTNSICNPWHAYGQGLPIVHYDGPLRRAGDIGYIQEPFSKDLRGDDPYRPYEGDAIRTNSWQSICLADRRILNTKDEYSFSAGSSLEFFTVRCATNTPVRGLVHAATPWQTVVAALASDMKAGTGADRAPFDSTGIEWITNVFFKTQHEMYDAGLGSIPVGVGDFCMSAGAVDAYYKADAIDAGRDSWHWRDNWGSDSKEDILREFCERLSFRQQIYGVYLVARSTTPAMTVGAERKALAVVLRDGYTGAWYLLNWIDL